MSWPACGSLNPQWGVRKGGSAVAPMAQLLSIDSQMLVERGSNLGLGALRVSLLQDFGGSSALHSRARSQSDSTMHQTIATPSSSAPPLRKNAARVQERDTRSAPSSSGPAPAPACRTPPGQRRRPRGLRAEAAARRALGEAESLRPAPVFKSSNC